MILTRIPHSRSLPVALETISYISKQPRDFNYNCKVDVGSRLISMPSKASHEFVTPCQRKTYEYHRARVKSATSVVDVIPPKVRPHIKYDAKKKQIESERQEKIIRENFILLKKLEAIMYKK